MCLKRSIINNPLRKAYEDVLCYKCVVVAPQYIGNPDKFDKLKIWWLRKRKLFRDYMTYFMGGRVTIGEVILPFPVYSEGELRYIDKNHSCLSCGFIHSFRNKEDAIKFANKRKHTDVMECVIPAGAYYFEGYNNNSNIEGYASTQIKYIKVL